MLLSTKPCLYCEVGWYKNTFSCELIFSNLESPLVWPLHLPQWPLFSPPLGTEVLLLWWKLSSGKAPTMMIFTTGLLRRFLTTPGNVLHNLWPANLLFPKGGSSVTALLWLKLYWGLVMSQETGLCHVCYSLTPIPIIALVTMTRIHNDERL